jgi:hypothetical protein
MAARTTHPTSGLCWESVVERPDLCGPSFLQVRDRSLSVPIASRRLESLVNGIDTDPAEQLCGRDHDLPYAEPDDGDLAALDRAVRGRRDVNPSALPASSTKDTVGRSLSFEAVPSAWSIASMSAPMESLYTT